MSIKRIMKAPITKLGISVAFASAALASPRLAHAKHEIEGGFTLLPDIPVVRRSHVDNGSSQQKHARIGRAESGSAPVAADVVEPGTSHTSGGDKYIVILKNGQVASAASTDNSTDVKAASTDEATIETILALMGLTSDHPDVRSTYSSPGFNGFTAALHSHCLDILNNHSSVAVVEKVQEVSIQTTYERQGAPWGLQRLSSSVPVSGDEDTLTFHYDYSESTLGAGVDIYIVDTGINTEHIVFGGRASMLWSYYDVDTDDNGHGTHVSGTSGGTSFGVASAANLIGVKVLDSNGTGSTDSVIQGILKAVDQHNLRKKQRNFKGSVINMSFATGRKYKINIRHRTRLHEYLLTYGAPASSAIDAAVKQAIDAGMHLVTSAGNSATDACTMSPASNGGTGGSVLTVGAIGSTDQISYFSNTGSCVDVYAPGEQVISSWISGPNVIKFESGTSMSAPHVTGLVATTIIQQPELALDPTGLKQFIQAEALKGEVTGQALPGDQLLLANNGITTAAKVKRAVRSRSNGKLSDVVKIAVRARRWLDKKSSSRLDRMIESR